MYNQTLYNQELYNGNHGSVIELLSDDDASFNGFSFANGKTVIASDIFYEGIERDIEFIERPQAHGQIVNQDFWRSKTIKITGHIYGDTQAELEANISEFKKQVSKKEGKLDIVLADGSRRRFIATQVNRDFVPRGKHYHVSYCPFDLEFECSTPFGQSLVPNSEGNLVTDLVYRGVLNNEGNALADVDVIMIVNSATNISKVNMKNDTTGEEIELETSISAGDTIKFDGKNKKVLLNGDLQMFVGSLLTAEVGANNYTLTFTGDDIQCEVTTNTPKNQL